MKKILICAALFTFTVSGCKKTERISYSGVFRLDKQTISGGTNDTVLIRKQMKIYTLHNYMYAGMAPDSSVSFGVGSYELDSGNRIDEHNIYNNRALDSTQIFVVKVSKTPKGRTQVVPDFGRSQSASYTSTEDYTKIPTTDASALDGVWELDKVFWVKGKDTLRQHETKFKAFWGGHFMFIHHYPVNAVGTEYKNGFGYGTFSLKNGTLSEENEMSNHAALLNRKLTIKVTFNGTDKYTQVINDPKTNVETTEIYNRLR
ncbi:MAG: hypothetical protein JWQ66_489 [Mucilaginibacter sp.]|nr:hypothetical protein [Mucilaginibacter sp.]